MERLYDNNEKYLPAAYVLMSIANSEGIHAAFAYAKEKGYSIRETSQIIQAACVDSELSALM